LPSVQLGSGDVVEMAGTGLIVKLKALAAVARAVSVTVAVKLAGPAAVGVPEMTPVAAASDNPAGRAPAVIVHEKGLVPPVAVKVVL